jgi:hypothetical protein
MFSTAWEPPWLWNLRHNPGGLYHEDRIADWSGYAFYHDWHLMDIAFVSQVGWKIGEEGPSKQTLRSLPYNNPFSHDGTQLSHRSATSKFTNKTHQR